jgi:hypothetical protein
MKGKTIGYRFGGTEEQWIVSITESADPVEAAKQKQYIESFPGAGQIVDLLRALDLEDAMPAKSAILEQIEKVWLGWRRNQRCDSSTAMLTINAIMIAYSERAQHLKTIEEDARRDQEAVR